MKTGYMRQLYAVGKQADVGTVINCPGCGQTLVKKTKHHKYHNQVCKDAYWNQVDPRKRNNTTRISPASARFMASRPVREPDYDDDPSWDAHKDSM